MYGDNAIRESTARKWFSRFKEDRFDISDTPVSGRPSAGVFNLLSSRANLDLSYNPAGRSHLHLHHRHFTYVTAHSPTLLPLYLHHNPFYNTSAASSMSQVILQPFRCFTYITGTSCTSPGEPPMHRGMKKQSVVDWLVTASY